MTQKLYNSTDKRLNPTLAGQLAGLRGGMVGAAERQAMPARFDATPHPDRPAMIITDVETGRAHVVPLCSYGEVRAALNAFFA